MSVKDEDIKIVPESKIHYVKVIRKNGKINLKPILDLPVYVYNFLKEHGSMTRNALSKLTGIPRTTLYDVLNKLILNNKIRKIIEKKGKRGRPKVYYEVIE